MGKWSDFKEYIAPYTRFRIWYFCFYVGYPAILVLCIIYAFFNPDDAECWYGE